MNKLAAGILFCLAASLAAAPALALLVMVGHLNPLFGVHL